MYYDVGHHAVMSLFPKEKEKGCSDESFPKGKRKGNVSCRTPCSNESFSQIKGKGNVSSV